MMYLIVDVFNVLFASTFALSKQLTTATMQDATLYGFLRTLIARLENYVGVSEVFLALDNVTNKKEYWKHQLFPEYKANRKIFKNEKEKQEKEEIIKQTIAGLNELKELCKHLPVYITSLDNAEGDDVIAFLSNYYVNVPKIIVSGDKDMRQLVSPTTSVFVTYKKLDLELANFEQVCDIKTPIGWLLYLVLRGDKVDNIPGITRVGEVTAKALVHETEKRWFEENLLDYYATGSTFINYFLEHKDSIIDSSSAPQKKSTKVKLNDQSEINKLYKNLHLIDLRVGSETLIQAHNKDLIIQKGIYDPSKIREFFERKDFKSLLGKEYIFQGMASCR